jgi:hypothetical protein
MTDKEKQEMDDIVKEAFNLSKQSSYTVSFSETLAIVLHIRQMEKLKSIKKELEAIALRV